MSAYAFEWVLGAIYALLGPVFWGLSGFLMIKGRQRMSLVNLPARPLPENPPPVSILIPAKDEGVRIADCVRSALAQDYPDLEVLAINDRSTDDTGAVLDKLASENPRLRVVHIRDGELPAGWTGKNNALATGVRQASGQWLLFIDSDVILNPPALRAAIAECLYRNFDTMSLILRLESHSFWEWLLVPLAAGSISFMYQIPLNNTPEAPRIAFANGQFLMFRRDVYEAVGGHASVKDQFCEDMAFSRMLKSRGFRSKVSLGIELASVRMYSSFSSVIRGWSRIFFAASSGSPWRTLVALLVVICCGLSAYAAMAWGIHRNLHPVSIVGGWLWLLTGGFHLLLMHTVLGMIYHWTGNRGWASLLFPLSAPILIYIYLRALIQCATGRVTWRGTSYGGCNASNG